MNGRCIRWYPTKQARFRTSRDNTPLLGGAVSDRGWPGTPASAPNHSAACLTTLLDIHATIHTQVNTQPSLLTLCRCAGAHPESRRVAIACLCIYTPLLATALQRHSRLRAPYRIKARVQCRCGSGSSALRLDAACGGIALHLYFHCSKL